MKFRKIIIGTVLISVVGIYILARINFNKIQNQLIINKETERLLKGGISTGFFNPDTSQIVEFGDLYVPIDGILKGKVNFNQKHEENDIRNYSLIVFADFIQQEFTVYNESYFSFPFSLEGKEGIVIDFELEINVPDVHEFSYIILFEPELKDVNVSNERLIKNLFYTIGIASWRLLLNEDSYKFIGKNDNNGITFNSEYTYNSLSLVKNHNDMKLMPIVNGDEEIEMVFSNNYSEERTYVFIAISDNLQIPFSDGEMRKIITIPSGENIYYPLIVPSVETVITYQIFAFLIPIKQDRVFDIRVISSERVLIVPNS